MARRGKITGLIGLAGVALAAWYFLDPKKGKERRDKVAEGAKKAYHDAEVNVRKLSTGIASSVTTAVDRTADLAKQGFERVSDISHTAAERARSLTERGKDRVSNDKVSQ